MKRAQVRELWESRLAAYTQSGMDIKAWCMANDISLVTFQSWRKKLVPTPPTNPWIPVTIVDESPRASQSGVSIRLGSIVIDVDAGFDHQVLRSVVDTLRA